MGLFDSNSVEMPVTSFFILHKHNTTFEDIEVTMLKSHFWITLDRSESRCQKITWYQVLPRNRKP